MEYLFLIVEALLIFGIYLNYKGVCDVVEGNNYKFYKKSMYLTRLLLGTAIMCLACYSVVVYLGLE